MSLLRVFACSNRKSLYQNYNFHRFDVLRFKPRQQNIKPRDTWSKLLLGSSNPAPCYSSVARPHISKSLQKWKRKKRKSKAQQKRELECLQKDFTQLLTKRAIQLLREDSYHNKNRQVVTSHTFTNDSVTRLDNVFLEALTTEIGASGHLKVGDNLYERLDVHVQNLLHKKDGFDSKNIQNVSPKSFLSEFPNKDNSTVIEERCPPTHVFTKDNTLLCSEIVQQYLNSRQKDVNTTGLSSTHHSNFLLPSYSDIFQRDKLLSNITNQKLLKYEKAEDPVRISATKDFVTTPEPSTAFRRGNKFSDLFLKFQEGLRKSCDSERNWEVHDENDHGIIPSVPKDLDINSNALPLPAVGQPNSKTDQLMFEDKIEKIPTEDNTLLSPKTNLKKDSPIKTKTKGDPVMVPDKGDKLLLAKKTEHALAPPLHNNRRKPESEHNEFQELIDTSFIDVCCFTGNELLAVRNIEFQSNKHGICSLDSINRLIHALAKKQNLEAIKSLFSLLRHWNVTPSMQTYAGCLECVGRMGDPDTYLCERLLADIEKAGYDIAEITNICKFDTDEWDFIIKAIRLVNPDFVPNEATLMPGYTHEMLLPLMGVNSKRLESNQYALEMGKTDMMERFHKQMEMEKKGVVEIPSIAAPSEKSSEDKKLKKLRQEIWSDWRIKLCESFKDKLKTYEKKAQNNMNMTVYPYLKLFSPEVYADIVFKNMQELLTSSEGFSPTQVMIQSSLGHAVNRLYNVEARISAGVAEKVSRLYDHYAHDYLDQETVLDNHRNVWGRAMAQHWDTVNMDCSMKKWPRHVIKMVGKLLLDCVLYDLKIDANLFKSRSHEQRLVPAFCTIYRPDVTTVTMAEIKVHPVVTRLFKMNSMDGFQFEPNIVPMLVPPVPWISRDMGGLLLGFYSLVRMGDDLYHYDALKNVKDSQYSAVLDSLNTLSACAWKINNPILDLQIQIFKSNGDANLKVSPPSSVLPPLPTIKSNMTGQEKAALYRERVQLQHQKRDMHGLWCNDLYRLSIANKFRDEIFWFPHSMDFRGRTYPLPPHFNHLGSDNVRSMLLFAKGKPLGPKGHDWLKIHLVNLTGFQKRNSNADRLAFADSMMAEILDSADKPLTGRKWWQTSDEPWQTLACCMELAKIERLKGNKEDYVCHFPVHQDGSCNGLQHYAALGRDTAGAESVNLKPFEVPQDVYSDVVELVERERKKDAEQGHELATALEGFVKRKVIKQTIMTTVYGVTRFGAKAQIHKQLKDIPDFRQDLAWKASFYLTEKTFSSLREMFRATKDIQDWLTEAAQLISAFKPVDWVTPLGFPVVQPYFKRSIDESRNKYTSKPNVIKQKNAFPPNYIHSLDSTHMMLTSLYSMHEGITFVSVHDCYWTHACDVPIMNRVCREQFVNMHKQPLLEDLSEHLLEIVDRASTDPSLAAMMTNVDKPALKRLLVDVPKRGTFDLDDILKSTYFFS